MFPFRSEFVVEAADELWMKMKRKKFEYVSSEKLKVIHLVVVLWRSSIIKLLVSFDTSSIFNTEFDGEESRTRLLLLVYFSASLSSTEDGMITDDFKLSSYVVGTARENGENSSFEITGNTIKCTSDSLRF